jgi:hypothetical protein
VMCATPRPRTISRMRVRARYRCLQHAMGAATKVIAQDAESVAERGRTATARAAAAARPDECSSRHREEEVQAQPWSAAGRRTGVSGRRWLGLTDDWRRMTRA